MMIDQFQNTIFPRLPSYIDSHILVHICKRILAANVSLNARNREKSAD